MTKSRSKPEISKEGKQCVLVPVANNISSGDTTLTVVNITTKVETQGQAVSKGAALSCLCSYIMFLE